MSRSYCFTLNEYTLDELAAFWDHTALFRYIIFGAEKAPTTGTKHLQGYFELSKPQRITFFKKNAFLARAHLEQRKGTREQAREYCTKEGDLFEWGNWAAGGQGARTDLHTLMDTIKKGDLSTIEIMESDPVTYSNNMRFCEKYQALCEKERTREFRKVDVEVIWGDAGTGKTRKVHEHDNKVFTVNCSEPFPFEGYDGEKTICLDDFYGGIPYHLFLNTCDGHQQRVNVKGSHRYAQWTKVFITSNEPPENWYKKGFTPAMQRRISKITHLENTAVTTSGNEVPGNTETGTNMDAFRLDWE